MAGKETTVFEDITSIFDKSGTLGRQVIMDTFEGQATDLDDIKKIFKGEKYIPPEDIRTMLEEKSGLNFTFGTGDYKEDNLLQNTANFATTLALDIFTSPDALIGVPAKLAKLGKFGKLASNPLAVRAIQGATLGALATQKDDDLVDILGKVSTGAGLGAFGLPAVKAVGSVVGDYGTKALDAMSEKNYSEVFDAYHGYIRARTAKGLPQRTKQIFEDLQNQATTSRLPFESRYDVAGLSKESPMYKAAKANEANALKKEGEALFEEAKVLAQEEALTIKPLSLSQAEKLQVESLRNTEQYSRLYKSEADNVLGTFEKNMQAKGLSPEAMQSTMLDFRHRVANGFSSIVDVRKEIEDNVFKQLKDAGQVADPIQISRYASSEANKRITGEVLKKAEENPLIREAIKDWVSFNRKTAKVFNDKMFERARFLQPSEAKKFLDKVFIPIDLHTVDTRAMDDMAEATTKFSDDFGPSKRMSSIVDVNPNVTMREATEIGANRYAGWFADQAESEAKSLLAALYDAKDQKSVMSRMIENSKRVAKGEKGISNEVVGSYIDGFDKMTNLLKTKHLASGTSWAMINYPDNVLKALIAAGPTTALRVASQVPMQALSNLGDFITTGRLKNLKDRNTLGKMLSAYDPTDTITKIDYDDVFMEAGMQFKALDSNQFVDVFQLGKVNGGILDMKVPSTKAAAIRDAIEGSPKIEQVADRLQHFLWKTVGSFGSAIEGTSRHIMFKDIALGEMKNHGALNALHKEGKLMDLLKLRLEGGTLPKTIGRGEIQTRAALSQMEEAFTTAAKITNDTFFDYKNINAFERHVVKRIMPYWTFKSRDLQFWLQNMFDPEKIERIAQGTRLHSASGSPLSEKQRMKTPHYLLEKGVRVKSDDGANLDLSYSPSLSLISTANQLLPEFMGGSAFKEALGGINPLLKTPVEFMTNTQSLGSGMNVYPDEENPTSTIFEQAFTALPDSVLKSMGVHRDRDGRIKTNNKIVAKALKIQEALPLVPTVLDQTARAIRDVKYRNKSLDAAFINNFIPVRKDVTVGPKQGRRELLKAIRNERKLNSDKRQDVLGRGR